MLIDLRFKRVRHTLLPQQKAALLDRQTMAALRAGMLLEDAKKAAQMRLSRLLDSVLWESATHRVQIVERATAAGTKLHWGVIPRKEPDCRRQELIAIGNRFSPNKRLAVGELYPAESRRKQEAEGRHLWEIDFKSSDARQQLDQIKPGELLQQGGIEFLALTPGEGGGWEAVQKLKSARFGAEREAVDLLIPGSEWLGAFLLIAPEGEQFGVGWA